MRARLDPQQAECLRLPGPGLAGIGPFLTSSGHFADKVCSSLETLKRRSLVMRNLGVSLAVLMSGVVLVPFSIFAAYAASVVAAALIAP